MSLYKEFFDKCKLLIYKEKFDFLIFGIGDYLFVKYKVVILGIYKLIYFILVSFKGFKIIMFDDICYFIGFDNLKMV